MRSGHQRLAAALMVTGLLVLGLARDSNAQLKGHYIAGFTGLGNGSQAPPSINLIAPVYFYTTDDIRNDDGESIGADPRINVTEAGH